MRSPEALLPPVVAVGLAGWGVADALVVGWSSPAPVSVLVALLAGLPIAWLVRHAHLVAVVVTVTLLVHALVWNQPEAPSETIALFVVAFGLGAYGATSYPLWAGLAAAVVVIQLRDVEDPGLGGVVFLLGTWVIALLVGRAVAEREAAARNDRLVAASTRGASPEVAAAALAAERERIARDLHDVVAYSVTLMVEHAAVGRAAVLRSPGTAEAAFVAVEETGQQALSELRRMLGLIRGGADTPGPQPGLAAVPSLTEASGATLSCEGDLTDVPDGPSVAAYRILQEALTNARRHAPGAAQHVSLVRSTGHLVLEVTSAGPAPSGWHEGRGLAGMRRRAAMYDGTLEAGPTRGGWHVRAVLALDG